MNLPFTELEKDWDDGKLTTVRRKIFAFLKNERSTLTARLQVALFYFHLQDFRAAIKYVPLHEILNTNVTKWRRIEVECLVFAARILNVLGASAYAFNLLEKIPEKQLEPFNRYVAGIFCTNRRFREAIPIFTSLVSSQAPSDEDSALPLARCFSGMGRYAEAFETIEQYMKSIDTGNPSLAAAAYSVLGEAHLLANQAPKARRALQSALDLYGKLPASNNVAYPVLWMGGCCAIERKPQQAKVFFKKAWELFYRQGLHPESWLQIYYWQGLSEFLESKVMPDSWSRLVAYPGSWPGSLSDCSFRRLVEEWTNLPEEIFLSVGGISKRIPPRHLEVLSTSQESAGLPEQLLINLILAGEKGVPAFREYELLWPNQVHAVSQLPKRFEQLCFRLRQNGLGVESSQGQHLYKGREIFVCWTKQPTDSFREFLKSHPRFQRPAVERYFKVSKGKAAQLCQQWVHEGRVSRENFGRATVYQTL